LDFVHCAPPCRNVPVSFTLDGMATRAPDQEPLLTPEEIREAVFQRMAKYRGRTLLEHFGMFMGLAQLLELALKALLHRRYGVELETMERWTFGQVARALRDRQLRPDFLRLLGSVVQYRNHVAHSVLADAVVLRELYQGRQTRFETRDLERGTYELEQLWFLFEWTEEHDAWGADAP
jgi:hypothetical protein